MSKASARKRMTHRVLVERKTEPTRDGYGAGSGATWATLHASLPCFFYRETRTDSNEVDRTRGTIRHDKYRLMVPFGTDLTERDRINGVTERDGTIIESGFMGIAAVDYSHSHVEVRLEKVS